MIKTQKRNPRNSMLVKSKLADKIQFKQTMFTHYVTDEQKVIADSLYDQQYDSKKAFAHKFQLVNNTNILITEPLPENNHYWAIKHFVDIFNKNNTGDMIRYVELKFIINNKSIVFRSTEHISLPLRSREKSADLMRLVIDLNGLYKRLNEIDKTWENRKDTAIGLLMTFLSAAIMLR